jgi:hypothetical protein
VIVDDEEGADVDITDPRNAHLIAVPGRIILRSPRRACAR